MLIGRTPDEIVLPLDASLHQDEGRHVEAVQDQADQSFDRALSWNHFVWLASQVTK